MIQVTTAPKPRSLLANGAVSLGASVVGAVLNFVLAVVIARRFGAADTGVFFAVVGVFLVLSNALKLGADTGLIRMLARLVALEQPAGITPTVRAALLPVLTAGVIAAITVFATAEPLGRVLFAANATTASDLVRILAFLVPTMTCLALLSAVIRGLGGVATFALIQNVLLPLSRLAGVSLAAAFGWSIAGAVGSWVAGSPVLVVVSGLAARRALHRATDDGSDGAGSAGGSATGVIATPAERFREFWAFSLPRAGSALIEISLEWLDVVLVAALAGPEQAGVYAVATRCVKVAMVVDYAFRVALSTPLSAALALQDQHEIRRLYEVGTRLLIGLIWPYLAVLFAYGDVAMTIFGDDFAGGWALVTVMATGMLAFAAGGCLQSILLLSGLSRRQLLNKAAALGVCLSGNLLLTPSFGARGAAFAWVASILTDTGLAAIAVRRRLGASVGLRPVLTVGAASLLAVGGTCAVVRWMLGANLPSMAIGAMAGAGVLLLVAGKTGQLRLLRQSGW